ncbi:bifunctional diguanylate cyclase/phosphodiesterase [Zobellella iuensis]|uniref:EAL domain-containing protein n=1 Tax=Zobellella iuensis TaxID=2803811 RepID=A0ABS1QW92_9GAMM|nr:EAL domain-containing protein [Zobellella iuensis]MBL1379155.1 EAL domain-containing protein [Zobellella iuensis]
MPPPQSRLRNTAKVVVILVLLSSLLVGSSLIWQHSQQEVKQQKLAAIDIARFHINSLQVQLERNLSSAYALAALIKQGQGDIQDFGAVAGQLLPFYPQVKALALSPGGIVTKIYPLAGNEGALGLNQFTHPAQRKEARLARDSRRLTLTGPVELAQGGVGLIGRLPVFMAEDDDTFWGFVSVVILLSDLLADTELQMLEQRGYAFELWRQLPTASIDDTRRQTIARSAKPLDNDAITESLALPNHSWQLSLAQPGGWRDTQSLAQQLLGILVFSLMLAFLVYLLAQTRWQARRLELRVEARTREISEARNQLEATLARQQSLITASNTGAWEYDRNTGELNGSDEYFSMLGLGKQAHEQGHGRRLMTAWEDLLHPEDKARARQAFAEYLAREEDTLYENQFRMRHANGNWIWILARGRTLRDRKGQPTPLTVGTHIDITQQIRDKEQIHFLAHFDPLTGLPNRSLLVDRTRQAIQLVRREQGSLALLFLDLDRFKGINDSLGHNIGDKLLVQVAERLRQFCREEDTISRFGGDEFILVLPLTDAEGAAHFAQRLLATMTAPFAIKKHDIRLSVSLGIALYPDDGLNFNELYHHADIAMYQAKEAGRNGYRFFTTEMQSRYSRMLLLENGLRQAIERQQLSLVYQPQFTLAEYRLTGFEALLRWQHPELGMISPAEFIPIAEKNGFIMPLGEWVLATALRQQARWQQQGLPATLMGVNVSAVQFRHPRLGEQIRMLLAATEVPAQQLELELTESVMMDNPQRTVAVMEQLNLLGIHLALDDFGTGYSSLSYLKRLRLARLKIDQSFVRDLLIDEEDRTIIGTIISLARNLGLQTIAEGVESREQLEMLRTMGCDQAQGYHLGRPLSAEQATELLLGRRSFLS